MRTYSFSTIRTEVNNDTPTNCNGSGTDDRGAVGAQDRDRVFLIKGVTATGKIESINRNQVVIAVKGNPQKYATNEIAKIVFDDEPSSLENARNFINNRQFNQAESELNKVGEQKDKRIALEVQYMKAYVAAKMALSGMGDALKAASQLVAALNANQDSHHFYQGKELMGDLAMSLGKADNAAVFYAELAQAPFPEIKALAAYKLGDVALTANKTAEARKQFELLINAKSTDAEMTRLKNLAEAGLAVCDAKDGKSQEALAKLRQLVNTNDNTDQPLFARLFNAMGMCYEALGQTEQAANAYLVTDMLYSSVPDLHAEALYHMSKLLPKVNEPQNGTAALNRLKTKYPASPWSNMK